MTLNPMFFIDLIPVLMAITAIFGMGFTYKNSRRKLDRVKVYLASLACIILIIAQSGWTYSYYILNDLKGTEWSNYAW